MDGAIRLLEQAAAPDRVAYSLKLAEAYLAAGRVAAARDLLRAVGERNPNSAPVRAALARVYARQGAWAAVVESLQTVEPGLDAEAALLLAAGLQRTGRAAVGAATMQRALQRFPDDERLWLAWIDAALGDGQWALALRRAQAGLERLKASPAVRLRAAQAYFGLGAVLGVAEVREVPGGRAGAFAGRWLLVEQRGPGRFLCCPESSALYQLRRALEAGLDEPAAHVLHARIWQKLGKARLGLSLLKRREAVLLEGGGVVTLEVFAELALEADALDDYLRYSRLRVDACPDDRAEILGGAYLAVAQRYGQRGELALHREFCQRALRLRPDDMELMLRVADAEWSAKRYEEAVRLYRRVLGRDAAHAARGRMLERMAAWQERQAEVP